MVRPAHWRKPPPDTEKTHRWANLTITGISGWATSPGGPGSWELLMDLVELPFRLVFALLRLVVRVLSRGLKIWK